jgi:membrane associated rhomboid family serine protease
MSLTILIIVITVGLSLYAWRNESVFYGWMMNPYDISRKQEWWRFLSSGFIHADWGHLIFNMISFYFFGDIVEQTIGRAAFLALYLLGIALSDVPSYFKHRRSYQYNSLGASGGVSAVIFAGIMFYPLSPIYLFFIPVGIPGFLFAAMYIMYSYVESRRGGSYTNHSAHLWGALFGIAFVMVLFPWVISNFFTQISNWRPF